MQRFFHSTVLARSLLWIVVALLVAIIVSPAFAQAPSTVIDLSPLVAQFGEYAGMAIVVLANVLIGAAVRYFLAGGKARSEAARKVALEIEKISREFVHETADRGLTLALSKVADGVRAVDVRSTLAAEAIDYVQRQAPDALKRLDAGPDALGRLIEAKLSEVFPVAGAASADFVFSGGAIARAG